MTYNPQTLRDLGAYWVAQGGVNLGVVGDANVDQARTGFQRVLDEIQQVQRQFAHYTSSRTSSTAFSGIRRPITWSLITATGDRPQEPRQ